MDDGERAGPELHWRLSRQPPVLTTTLPTGPAAQERGHWRLCRQPPVPTPSEPAPRKPEDLAREVFRLFGTSLRPAGRLGDIRAKGTIR